MNALCMEECGNTCHCLWATGVQVKTDFRKGDLLHSGHSCHIPSRNWAMCWFSFPLPIADSTYIPPYIVSLHKLHAYRLCHLAMPFLKYKEYTPL